MNDSQGSSQSVIRAQEMNRKNKNRKKKFEGVIKEVEIEKLRVIEATSIS